MSSSEPPLRLSRRRRRARLHPPMHRFAALDARLARRSAGRLCRLRLHRRQPAYRQPDVDHAAAPVPADRQQADRADGRRHDPDRRPLGQGREPASCSTTRRSPRNMAGIRKVFAKFLHFGDGPTDAVMVNNADWLDELRYIPFLRDVGRHFSVNRMLTLDSVRLRLERDQPLSLPRIQLPDPAGLRFRRAGAALRLRHCRWAAPTNGATSSPASSSAAARDGRSLFGLTTPLITTASGAKMGKSAQGAVWLNAERLSPYDYWQFWRNTEDADVGRFLRLFTELPLTEIARLETLAGAEINEAKKVLATEATALCARPRGGRGGGRDGAARVRDGGGRRSDCRRSTVPRDAARARHAGLRAVRPRRARRVERRGAPADQGRRRPHQRQRRRRRDAAGLARRSRRARRRSSSAPAASGTPWCGRNEIVLRAPAAAAPGASCGEAETRPAARTAGAGCRAPAR